MPLALREAEKSTPYRSWKAEDWTASDDRVRGGKSQVGRLAACVFLSFQTC